MKCFGYICCFLALLTKASFLCAQINSGCDVDGDSPKEERIEQLLQTFETATDKKLKYETADTLMAVYYQNGYLESPLTFNNSTSADSVLMLVYFHSAWYFFCNEKWQSAIDYSVKSLPFVQNTGDSVLLSDVYHLQGLNCFRLGDFDKSTEAFKRTYDIDKHRGDASDMSNTLNCIAGTYIANKQPELAEPFILEAIRLNSTIDEPERMSVYLGMASETYHLLGDDDKARQYALKGLDIERKLGRKGQTGKRLSQLASAYIGLGLMQDAESALAEALPLLKEADMIHSAGICENQLGDIFMKQNNPKDAVRHYQSAADIFFNQGDIYNESRSRYGLYEALKNADLKQALENLERYNLLKDSIYTIETNEKISKYNAQYQNDLLAVRNRNMHQKTNTYIVLGLLLFIIVALTVTIVLLIIRHKHKEEKQSMNLQIAHLQEKNEQLQTWYKNAIINSNKPAEALSEGEQQFLTKVIELANRQMSEGKVDADAVARHLGLSPFQLRNRLMDMAGMTPREFLLNIRMQKAIHLLDTQRNMSVLEVAYECGYADGSNFVHAFRKQYGLSPTEYRKRLTHNNISQ
ncbi:MAG: AraC family transcriptional regulator [Paludibacteraceae bacterium]|nr:AraC family transcriptional regulator [Paludibacteraceae bacterium]